MAAEAGKRRTVGTGGAGDEANNRFAVWRIIDDSPRIALYRAASTESRETFVCHPGKAKGGILLVEREDTLGEFGSDAWRNVGAATAQASLDEDACENFGFAELDVCKLRCSLTDECGWIDYLAGVLGFDFHPLAPFAAGPKLNPTIALQVDDRSVVATGSRAIFVHPTLRGRGVV